MPHYLIAHIPATGNGRVAQVQVQADTERQARRIFARHYPARQITRVGIRGQEEA